MTNKQTVVYVPSVEEDSYWDKAMGQWLKKMENVYVLTEDQLNEIENKSYKEGRESVSKADFNYD